MVWVLLVVLSREKLPRLVAFVSWWLLGIWLGFIEPFLILFHKVYKHNSCKLISRHAHLVQLPYFYLPSTNPIITQRSVNCVCQFNIKMLVLKSKRTSPGRTYKIKLYERQVKVQLYYQSPPKLNKENTNVNTSICRDDNQEKKASFIESAKKEDKIDSSRKNGRVDSSRKNGRIDSGRKNEKISRKDKVNEKRQRQFYENQIQQSKNTLEKYLEFHSKLAEGKTQARIKVYSNSKLQIALHHSNSRSYVPIKTVNISSAKGKDFPKAPVKIRLYSSPKTKVSLESSLQMKNTAKSQQRKRKGPQKQKQVEPLKQEEPQKKEQKSILTPKRTRMHKLQVTSSKSRGKNESIISKREENQKEMHGIQLKGCSQNIKFDRQGNSLNSVYVD